MNGPTDSDESRYSKPFVRPKLTSYQPRRGPAGFYRASLGKRQTKADAGLGLDSPEDAIVAAVRLGYKVASAQIDRSGQWANRLRSAGAKAVGKDSDRQAVDAAERLIFKSMMTGVGWLESLASDTDSPLKRVALAEYRILGSLFGFRFDDKPAVAPAAPTSAAAVAQPVEAESQPAPAKSTRLTTSVSIYLEGEVKRALRIQRFDVEPEAAQLGTVGLQFFCEESPDEDPFLAHLTLSDGERPRLDIKVARTARSGIWRAAVCGRDGRQLGVVDVVL